MDAGNELIQALPDQPVVEAKGARPQSAMIPIKKGKKSKKQKPLEVEETRDTASTVLG